MLTSRARIVTGPVRIKKISRDFIYDRTELKRRATLFWPNILMNSYLKTSSWKLLTALWEGKIQYKSGIKKKKKKILLTPNAVFITRNFIPSAVQCCIPRVKYTCQTTPNAYRVKIIGIPSVSFVQVTHKHFASGHAFVILSREIQCVILLFIICNLFILFNG